MTRAEFLLALVVDRPAGAKVDIPAIKRAFTPTQADVVAGIEMLIAKGVLDRETLRRPQNNETPVAGHDPGPSEPPAPRAEAKGGGAARYDVAPSPIDLGRLLECFGEEFETLRIVAQRFGATTSQKIARHARTLHGRGLVEKAPPTNGHPFCLWRRAEQNTQGASGTSREDSGAGESTPAKRIKDRASQDSKRGYQRKTEAPFGDRRYAINREPPKDTPPSPATTVNAEPRISRPAPCTVANENKGFQRQAQKALRTNRTAAEAFLDSGKTSGDAKSVSLRIEARKVEIRRAEEARQACPIEQAKTILRRRYSPVIAAETSGGPKGKFYVGKLIVDEAGLMRMAKAMAA